MTSGYYRYPTIHEDTIVFVSEDDLWTVPASGGVARRLTSNLGEVTYPMLSPDGTLLAYVGREEGGSEVYVMPAEGGSGRRLTYLNSNCRVAGWTQDSRSILFASNYGQVSSSEMGLFRVDADAANGAATQLPIGPARAIAFGPDGGVVIGRNIGDPARWKRYRGGTTGQLWIDINGDGEFERFLPDLQGNIAAPMWLTGAFGSRVFFISDHEGIGNLYSCLPDGSDLQRHSDHEDYYARNPSSDGRRIVYHAGADIYLFDPQTDQVMRVEADYRSPRVQRNRRFVDAGRYMDGFDLHPSGRALAMTTRGKAFAFYNHEGPVLQYGKRDGVRYRHATWLYDGRRLAVITDEPGEETLEIYGPEPMQAPRRLDDLDLGRVAEMKASPVANRVALTNHRYELIAVDLDSGEVTVVDRSPFRSIGGFDWSPDGRWLAYSFSATLNTSEIRLYRLPDAAANASGAPTDGPDEGEQGAVEGKAFTVTAPVLHDVSPSFDPDGRYLYFLSFREFNPVYDGLHFDLGFPWGMRPYLITLQDDLPNPFIPQPDFEDEDREDDKDGDDERGGGRSGEDEDDGDYDAGEDGYDDEYGDDYDDGEDGDLDDGLDDGDALRRAARSRDAEALVPPAGVGGRKEKEGPRTAKRDDNRGEEPPPPLRIDLDGIERRVVAFPVPDARYGQVMGIPGKALFTVFPLEGTLDSEQAWDNDEPDAGELRLYDFKEYKAETLLENINEFGLSANGKKLIYRSGNQLRVIDAGVKPPSGGAPRKSGWINLQRVKVSIDPQSEWEQMFREAWRLQRDHFWTEDMSQVDWQTVYSRYFPLIERVSTRSEFSDLMWEMQGELGTSHAYEFGGDYRPRPYYGQGFLGAELAWDAPAGGYRVGELLQGDPWDEKSASPLAGPGIDVKPGDVVLAINGQRLDANTSPAQLLVNQAGNEVLLTLLPRTQPEAAGADGDEKPDDAASAPIDLAGEGDEQLRSVSVRAVYSEATACYRRWVEENRRKVHAATGGRAGYVHIPDMGPKGYAEFHRGYLAEIDRDALIVDVRYNGGGHVSQLILEKLARRRLGYDLSRWGGLIPYPVESVAGPLVALTNEHAGSDGDIFCHSFKLMKLGPLIGKRTWGGVIGIYPRNALVDGTITTQPEYSFWFEDVGWNVENYGTDPDIEIDIRPQDYAAGVDAQLERAIAEALRLLEATPVSRPQLEPRPSRAIPKLPPRTPGA